MRQKLEFSTNSSFGYIQPYSSSKLLLEPGLTLGMSWENSGIGLQLEVRKASHNARFIIRNEPLYSASTKRDKIDFGLEGLFTPLFLTWRKDLGEAKKWGMHAKIGAGVLFINNNRVFSTEERSGTITSTITGSEQPFDWEVTSPVQRFDAVMIEAGIGVYYTISPHLELTGNLFSTQSFPVLSSLQVRYNDNVNGSGTRDITTDGEAIGLQIGIRYIFSK